ncbi:MAG: ABC transporter permease [Verrucomicrobiae bacterium]|nr:ABC transporter permease [Verrucomicrobiae bacterium]
MYFFKRILNLPLLLLLISVLAFMLIRLAPGGPFDRERKPASPEIERALLARYHLDEPLWKQYGRFLTGLVHGDFGASLKYRNHTVTDIILQGLPVSLAVGGMAFCLAMGLGIPAGFYGAVKRGSWTDHWIAVLTLVAVCVPGFVIGPILVMVFAVKLRWFPPALWGGLAHAVLPSVSLGLFFAGKVARLLREGMSETLECDFIRAARAKGLSETAILLRHGLRLGILPVVSYSGPMLADLLTGSFVVENLFQLPGIGVFLVNGSLSRDYPMVVGLVLVYAVLLLVLNLLVDLAYSVLDPRVKYV